MLNNFPYEFIGEVTDYYEECKKDPLGQEELEYFKQKNKIASFSRKRMQDISKVENVDEEEMEEDFCKQRKKMKIY